MMDPESIELQPVEKYNTSYLRKDELGRGKFGVVFQIEDKSTGNIMAAKHIKIRKEEHKKRVKEEIGILQNLSNPHVIKFVEAFENNRELILVMEYLDGGELFERVATEDFNLTESDCCLFIRQLCRGVDYLHSKQIVHLDLKPENVVCTHKDSNSLKIIDFGLAKKMLPEEKFKMMGGTPEFVAPEVVNYEFIDLSTDMWSVGVICYILLSGYSPFMGETDSETFSNISSVTYDFDEPEFDDISTNAKCLDDPWLLEKDIGSNVLKTDNLRKFLARRRWQRCGQAIRAMKRMSGLMLKRQSSLSLSRAGSNDSLCSTPPLSRSNSREGSPLLERKHKPEENDVSSESQDQGVPGMNQGAPGSCRDRAPRLNLLESRLREELSLETLVFRKQDIDEKNEIKKKEDPEKLRN
ncbi:myosin light chain kinase, smooth muscle isoform X2 [Eurytemora carolleeae]|uniref:myosin light chain kinase, smooth muscle isoform X2 n=1 Tax=Eurytemora carolleeae TaxID=1294199 RepID=UPI000C76EADE|nr:myosin light chain kinase, smooth muscle isoform X2 [Eurytemora carolleeae]|eukprot:XP_023328348.1 myosin light chain kinase, smooth muscle-like isoform X2 [Eurytemora affinis]